MVEITLFEFNLEAEDLFANAPFSGATGKEGEEGLLPEFDADGDDEDARGAAGDGPNLKPLLVGAVLLVLVLAVVAVRRLLGGEPEPLP